MVKQFLTYKETAEALGTDAAGLRQALETGLAANLPAFVHCDYKPFLARLEGGGAKGTFDTATGGQAVALANGTWITDGACPPSSRRVEIFDSALGDKLGDIRFAAFGVAEDDRLKARFVLEGFFRIAGQQIKRAARRGSFGLIQVAPSSWWDGGMPAAVGGLHNGEPNVLFSLEPPVTENYQKMPALEDAYFRAKDVSALVQHPAVSIEEVKELDARERASLLLIIGALAEANKLDLSQHIKAGGVVAKTLEAHGVELSARTIGNHLKAAKQAIEDRGER